MGDQKDLPPPHWGYDNSSHSSLGPACWHLYPPWGANIAERQSPIALVASSAVDDSFQLKLPSVTCSDCTVHNNGKTLKFYPSKETEITVEHPKTGDTFRMAE